MADNTTTRGGELFFPAADGPFFEWYPTDSGTDGADLICAELSRLAYYAGSQGTGQPLPATLPLHESLTGREMAAEVPLTGLACRGKSPPDVFPRMKTAGFPGCCAPWIASLRSSRLFIRSLVESSFRFTTRHSRLSGRESSNFSCHELLVHHTSLDPAPRLLPSGWAAVGPQCSTSTILADHHPFAPTSVTGDSRPPFDRSLCSARAEIMTRNLTAIIQAEDGGFVALCPQLDVCSQGDTVEEARANLQEALELFFETAPADEVTRRLSNEFYVTQLEIAVG